MPDERISAIPRRMARPKIFVDTMPFRDVAGTFASMDKVLVTELGEDRIGLLRLALDQELSRRQRETPEQTKRRIEAYRADLEEQKAGQRRSNPRTGRNS